MALCGAVHRWNVRQLLRQNAAPPLQAFHPTVAAFAVAVPVAAAHTMHAQRLDHHRRRSMRCSHAALVSFVWRAR